MYVEPLDYFPEETRKECKIGEYAEENKIDLKATGNIAEDRFQECGCKKEIAEISGVVEMP